MSAVLGLQKLTLLDFPGHTACTLFTGGCNFICPFCQNSRLVLAPDTVTPLDEEEIFSFLKKRAGLLDGVCITGGEPLLDPAIEELISRVRSLGYKIKLDTNGAYPDRLCRLVQKGLVDYVAMDLKNSPEHYGTTVGIPHLDLTPIKESVRFLLSNPVEYEFRTTVVREFHQAADFITISLWISGASRYFLQEFIDSGELIQEGLHGYSKTEMENFLSLVRPRIPSAQIRGL